jgi:hypothetical protein
LTYWNGRFWAYHIGFQFNESTKAGYLYWSVDGRNWNENDSAVAFPAPFATHQRTAFYSASNGKLLLTAWYSQNGEAGRGGAGTRFVREVKGPNDFGVTYILKQNVNGAASGTGSFSIYTSSSDSGFKNACAELLGNALYMQQYWEEDEDTAFYEVDGLGNNTSFEAKAFAWYRLGSASGSIIGNWKAGWVGVASSGNWINSQVVRDQVFSRFGENRSAKMWGEPLVDGRYALYYSMGTGGLPLNGDSFVDTRTPLAVSVSNNGLAYTQDPLFVSGDSGPQMFRNGSVDNKTTGASYTRGISWLANRENKPRFNDNSWVTYSTNKEVIWVTEVPQSVTGTVSAHVDDSFATMTVGGRVGDWNVRNGGWTPARLVDNGSDVVLRLSDKDPYDYSKVFRVFPESTEVILTTGLRPAQSSTGELHVELVDATGARPVRLRFSNSGQIQYQIAGGNWLQLAGYSANTTYELVFTCNTVANQWSVYANGQLIGNNLPFAESASSVERIEYRTGAWRLDDFSTNWYNFGSPGNRTSNLTGADDPVSQADYEISGLTTQAGINPPGGGSPTSLDSSGEVTLGQDYSSYADQDLSGNTSLSPDGNSITLAGNNWKRFPINYTVTADTVLEFTVQSSDTEVPPNQWTGRAQNFEKGTAICQRHTGTMTRTSARKL